MQHEVVSREDWRAARAALIAKEKAFTRAGDALSAEQRALPWVEIEKTYVFQSASGPRTLSDLFDGRSQLFVKLFMFNPGQTHQCTGCSLEVDHVAGLLEHLNGNDVSYVVIAPAPIDEIEDLRRRMDWRFPWVSSFGSDFHYDAHVTFNPEGVSDTGNLVFYKDEEGRIFHTYSAYSRGAEGFLGIYRIFDLMPKGRNENGPYHTMGDWVRPRNMYGKGGMVERNGRYHPQACVCEVHAEARSASEEPA
jgi:predicted dithiol-disulfide oxidoreductase (DUF899 family)